LKATVTAPMLHLSAGVLSGLCGFGGRRWIAAGCLGLAAAWGWALPVRAEREELEAPAVSSPAGTVSYRVEILGVSDEKLQALLEETSQLFALREKPPATLAGLERRIDTDLSQFEVVLRSEGFYAGVVRYEVDRERVPITVVIHIETGPKYRLAEYSIRYADPAAEPEELPAALESLGLSVGMRARARRIVEAERTLLVRLKEAGRPLARIVDRRVVVDHANHTLAVTLDVDPGPRTRFGPVAIEGLADVEEDYVRQFIDWTPGERYDQRKVDAFRSSLVGTGLFATVRIDHADTVEADGTLPVTITVVERQHRSVGVGASYSTSEGVGGEVFWEHRNLLGRQERLRLSARGTEIDQAVSATFRKPHFKRRDQDLLARASVSREETDAFDARSLFLFAGLERQVSDEWRVAAGVPVEYSLLDDREGERTFVLLGLSLGATRDSTDSRLDAARGTRVQLSLTPYHGFDGDTVNFAVSEVAAAAFVSPFADDPLVLAGRARVGSIVGPSTETLPANKRFYAGGGGSIRGYEFQRVGPLDEQNDPLGGRSVLEVGVEVRVKVTEAIGFVAFLDGGNVFDETIPDLAREFQWAAGFGLRYFTSFGPLRFDIGFPINPREGIDDAFQFYISVGQAF
jgi:translocation and assembly module TamA